MTSFEARKDSDGLWIVTVDGVEHKKHYTDAERSKLYEDLWWEDQKEERYECRP